jgi:N6-L-threonylcarbamoyladenine synthase
VPELTRERMRDIAASFQRAAVRALMLKLGRAIERIDGCQTLIVGGGVSANTLVRSEMDRFANEHGLELIIPKMGYCVDNAAMIAGLGAKLFQNGRVDDLTLSAVPTTAC